MNLKLTLFVLVIAGLSSCSTAYKIEQTPDDVYYSPTPQVNEYVQTNNEADRNVYNNASPEDREIYRDIHSRRWRRHHYAFDENIYGYSYPYGYYPYGNSYPVYVNPKTGTSPSAYIAPRKYNLGTYTTPSITNYTIDAKTGKIIPSQNISPAPARTFRPNNGTAVGNFVRNLFTPNTNSYNSSNNSTTQSRSFETSRSSNNSTSSSTTTRNSTSSSSSNAPVRSFKKN